MCPKVRILKAISLNNVSSISSNDSMFMYIRDMKDKEFLLSK